MISLQTMEFKTVYLYFPGSNLEEYKHHPEFAKACRSSSTLESMWEEYKYDESPQWGMTIDLNVCTGCNACTTPVKVKIIFQLLGNVKSVWDVKCTGFV